MLSAEELTLRYGHQLVLDDVSLDIDDGEIRAILGGNAAGKTSLLRALAGLEQPERGRVVFRSSDITRLRPDLRARCGLAFSPAERQLFPDMTVRENLEMGALARHSQENGASAGELDMVWDLFPTLADRQEQRAGSLSGGEQKMVAIGRALMSRPKLLMLDEPSLGLAGRMKETMAHALAALRQMDLTILLTEQDVALAERLADRATFLERGQVVDRD